MKRTILSSIAIAAALFIAPEAQACGGFFCNATTLTPVFQAAERVLFVMDEGSPTVTMHVEVGFAGEDATDFAWMIPLPAIRAADGSTLPLEEMMGISSPELFDALQRTTTPSFQVDNIFHPDYCGGRNGSRGSITSAGTSANSLDSSGAAPGFEQEPAVRVVERAEIGAYAAELVEASDADALYDWLARNDYLQDPAARPLLEHYVNGGYVFLGLRLQAGTTVADLSPVSLQIGEIGACVPLRLTSIAATPDMPILVWVLGAHRAIPKNFLHTVVNPRALTWPGGANYVEVVTEAVNASSGRAFVTEYAGSASLMDGALYNDNTAAVAAQVATASSLSEMVGALASLGLSQDDELQGALRRHVPMPDGLTGFPYDSCWSVQIAGLEADCETAPEDHLVTEDEYYAFLDYWVTILSLESDLEALRGDLASVFDLRSSLQGLFDAPDLWLTRFFTTMSDDEMSRDPIFALNPELGEVPRIQTLETVIRSGHDCTLEWVEAYYPDGSKAAFNCPNGCGALGTLGPVEDARPLLHVEVLDETGGARAFVTGQVDEVDALLDQARLGEPNLPRSFRLELLPDPDGAGCSVALQRPDSSSGGGALLLLFGLVALRRRGR